MSQQKENEPESYSFLFKYCFDFCDSMWCCFKNKRLCEVLHDYRMECVPGFSSRCDHTIHVCHVIIDNRSIDIYQQSPKA